MKILHTSDWHLGHILYNYDRTEEQTSMIQQMVDIVNEHKPDVFLLSGDVYHTSQPSAAVQTMFTNALVQLHDANPSMNIIVTAGNHDSGTKHEIFRTPWKALKVHTIGNLDRDNMGEHIIKVADKGFVIAIPYAYERNIPDGFFQNILNMVAEQNTENLPVVMMAHTTVTGCDFTGHERTDDRTVGGIESLDIKDLGEGYDYMALGHIHHEQFVHTGKHNVRYSGTPIPVSFDENYEHSVSLVEIGRHGETPTVNKTNISNPHPLVTLPTVGTATWNDAKALLEKFPNDIQAYIRLNVEVEDFLPTNAHAEAVAISNDKQCRFCYINSKRRNVAHTGAKEMTIQEFREEKPIDIALRYANDEGITFDDKMVSLFNEALESVIKETRND